MIEVTPLILMVVGVSAFLIGFSKAGIGGSMGPLITILVVLVLPVGLALGVLLPLLIVGDAFTLAALWRRWSLREVARLLPGVILGVVAGTYLLSQADSPVLARVLGALVLLFVAYWVLEPRITQGMEYRARAWHGHLAGAVAGVASALAHSGGPPVTVYLLLQRFKPVPFVATSALVFAVVNVIKIPAYLSAGLFDLGLQLELAWAAGLVPIGVLVGRFAVQRIDPLRFHRVIVALLAFSGLYLLLA